MQLSQVGILKDSILQHVVSFGRGPVYDHASDSTSRHFTVDVLHQGAVCSCVVCLHVGLTHLWVIACRHPGHSSEPTNQTLSPFLGLLLMAPPE